VERSDRTPPTFTQKLGAPIRHALEVVRQASRPGRYASSNDVMCGSPTAIPLGMGYRTDRADVPRVEPLQRHVRLLLLLLTYRKR